MDGREAARLISAVSQAPILMITAFAERDDELHGIASGATAYLIKPFRPRQLRELALKLSPQNSHPRIPAARPEGNAVADLPVALRRPPRMADCTYLRRRAVLPGGGGALRGARLIADLMRHYGRTEDLSSCGFTSKSLIV